MNKGPVSTTHKEHNSTKRQVNNLIKHEQMILKYFFFKKKYKCPMRPYKYIPHH